MKDPGFRVCGAALVLLLGGCTKTDPPLPDDTDGGLPPPMTEDLAAPLPTDMTTSPRDMAPDLAKDLATDMVADLATGMTPDMATPGGCTGKAPMMPGTLSLTMTWGSKMRSYFLHVPTKYDPKVPTSLVLAFHGYSDKAADFMKYIDIEAEADKHNVIAIVPQGLGFVPGWNAGNCCGEPQLFKVDDVGFARALIDATKHDFCVDEKRVYATGFSNGGMFSHRLACELSDVLAAVGPVSGGPMVSECKPTRAISVLHFHGTADPTCGYHGGGIGTFPDIPMAIDDWATRNSCTDTPRETFHNGAVSCMTRDSCAESSEVSLCTIDMGVHAWPGSSNGTPDIKGTATILDFFAKHAR